MDLFQHGPIQQISTTSPSVYAFRITGHMDDDAAEALAEFMNDAFDRHDEKIDMLLDLSGFTGSDWDSMFDGDVIESRFRALTELRRYAVIGAPAKAQKMIGFMDKLIPVEAKAFSAAEADQAWAFVGETPMAAQ
ncbi:STAS/SEC14 domain-containing protein [Dinoroseobacter sp. S375]|uniref:STAS/SEC14 domain-containing protein n=1 Tax=Dinoroseobacter sp. S375 TaxID=3415136 RepID=UPI003C7E0245